MSEDKKKKTVKEAYSWKGLGLFDLIPGVRDLPYVVRFLLMALTVIGIFYLLSLLLS